MKLTFNQTGDFQALYAAQAWCEQADISYGSLCRAKPVGLMRGEFGIAKWKHISAEQRKQLDGTITGDFRNGPVTIEIKDV
jgi:hypothetical protein